ncbi:kinase-like domain-containing protein [Gautieria morchelliformis]|nr:kinase-like domain-containing protein [Gautieria morchelliformis]
MPSSTSELTAPDGSPARPPPWLSRHLRPPSPPVTPPSPDSRHRMSSPDDFHFGEELGGGSWSTVHLSLLSRLCSHPPLGPRGRPSPTGTRYAIKVLNKAQLLKHKMSQYAVSEKNALAILSSVPHPGIVRLYSAFHDSTSLYLVLALAPNGDLRELVKKSGSLSLPCARYYAAQLVDTVQWVHSKGILHRDLKPENILLDSEMRIKLADFGSAYISKSLDLSPRTSSFVGTAAYLSPELLSTSSKTTSQRSTLPLFITPVPNLPLPSSDIWAIGCILYYFIVGQSPFLALNDYLSFKKIEALDYTFPDGFDPDAKHLVQRLLVLDPSDRLGVPPKSSPSELRHHPFFVGHSSSKPDAHPPYINWDTLWTDPPVAIASGLTKVTERERREEDGHPFSWGGFIQEFSLIEADDPLAVSAAAVSPANDAPAEALSTDPSLTPSDIPVNGEPRAASFNERSVTSSASLPSSPDTPTRIPTAVSRSDPPASPSPGSTETWSSILLPSETVRLATQVELRSRHRRLVILKTRQCTLILTTLPRLLCVKHIPPLPKKHTPAPASAPAGQSPPISISTPPRLVVKRQFSLLPVGGGGGASGSGATDPRPRDRVLDVNITAERTFVLETTGKPYLVTTPDQDDARRWVTAIQALLVAPPRDAERGAD